MDREKSVKVVVLSAIVGAHIGLLAGGILALEIGRMRLFGLFLYATVALLFFDVLFMSADYWSPTSIELGQNPPWGQWITDARLVGILISITVIIFALIGRGLVAYIVAALAGTALIYRVIHRAAGATSWTLVLAGFLAVVLLMSKVFTVPYLIHTFDTVKHAEIAESIVKSGTISQFQNTRFEGFLIFHVLVAVLVRIIAMSARPSTGLLFAIAFPASLLAIYAFISRRGISRQLALLAVVLFALSPPLLTWGSKAHYQSLSFVYFTFVLLIVGNDFDKRRAALIGVLISIAWVSTHHLSVLMAAVFLAILASKYVLSKFKDHRHSGHLTLIVFTIIATKWTILTFWVTTPILWIIRHSPLASSDLGSTGLYVEVYNSARELFVAAIPFFMDRIHLSLLLALSAIGMLTLLNTRRRDGVLLAGAVIGSIFYFPNPLWLPLRGLATLLRWDIMVQPFVIVLSAAGTLALIRGTATERPFRRYAIIIFIPLLLFSMVSAGFYSPTTSDFIGADRYDRQYLTNQDIEAAHWTKAYALDDQPIYATSKLLGYLSFTTDPVLTDREQDFRRARVTSIPGRVVFSDGLMVFQVGAFRTEAIKMAVTPDSEYYSTNIVISAPVSARQIDYAPEAANIVYSNGDTVVHESDAGVIDQDAQG